MTTSNVISFPQPNKKLSEVLDRWIFVGELEEFVSILDPSKRLDVKQFNQAHNHLSKFLPKKNGSYKRYSPSEYVKELNIESNMASMIGMFPNQDILVYKDIYKYFNTWSKPEVQAVKGNVDQFEDFISYLMNHVSAQTKVFTQYLAHIVQHPERRIRWMPMISSDARGLGKNFFADQIIKPLVGASNYVQLSNPASITGSFSDWQVGTTFVVLDEVLQTRSRSFVDRLKPLITNDTVYINPKGKTPYQTDNYMHFISFSNFRSSIQVDEGERRFFVVHNTQNKWSAKRFKDLDTWLKSGGIEAIHHYLLSYDLSDFDPNEAPFLTDDFHKAVDASANEVEQFIKDMIQEGIAPFGKSDLFTKRYIKDFIKNHSALYRAKIQSYEINNAMEKFGITPMGRMTLMDTDRRPELFTFGKPHQIRTEIEFVCSDTSKAKKLWEEQHIFEGRGLLLNCRRAS